MSGERQIAAGRGWSAAEKALLWLTFGCLALIAVMISISSLSRLIDETAPWPFVAAYLALPAALIVVIMALCRRAEVGTAGAFVSIGTGVEGQFCRLDGDGAGFGLRDAVRSGRGAGSGKCKADRL